MILVTGAAGKTGRAVIRALAARERAVRALVHRPEQAAVVTALGAQQAVSGDMRRPETLEQATQGVQAVYHICPNMSPDEVAIGQVVLAAARSAGVERFVYHSVLHPHTESMPHHWLKLRVEEYLIESGIPYTILQPAMYMQSILSSLAEIVEKGVYMVPYPVNTALSLVDLKDIAEVAAKVMTSQEHQSAIYELAGTNPLTQGDIALALEEGLGRKVQAQQIPLGYWERQVKSTGLDSYQINTLVKMFQHYEQFGFPGNPGVLGWLLGRQPTSLRSCLKRELSERNI